jgi:hypothetical protein
MWRCSSLVYDDVVVTGLRHPEKSLAIAGITAATPRLSRYLLRRARQSLPGTAVGLAAAPDYVDSGLLYGWCSRFPGDRGCRRVGSAQNKENRSRKHAGAGRSLRSQTKNARGGFRPSKNRFFLGGITALCFRPLAHERQETGKRPKGDPLRRIKRRSGGKGLRARPLTDPRIFFMTQTAKGGF